MPEFLSIIDRVEEVSIENKFHRLLSFKLYGIEVWPLIRVRLTNLPASSTHDVRPVRLGQIFSMLKGLINLVWNRLQLRLRPKSSYGGSVFFSHPECLAQLDGKWYDRMCDPIREASDRMGVPATVLEYSPKMQWIRPCAHPRIDMTLILVLAKLISLLQVALTRRRYTTDLIQLKNILQESGAESNISAGEVQRLAAFVSCAQVILAFVMRPWKFRIGFVCTYYSSSAMAFVMACRSLGISVFDIQHGVQGASHVAYRPWKRCDGQFPACLPDGFWCWDRASADQLQSWCNTYGGPTVLIGGNVWAEYVLSRQSTEDADEIVPDEGGHTRTVLVSLQPLPEPLHPVLLDAMANAPADVHWVVRLHPAMDMRSGDQIRAHILATGCSNFRMQNNDDAPLPRQLLHTDLHVTRYSSVVIEAAAQGVSSVLLDKRAVSLYNEAVASGDAVLVNTAAELLACVATAKRAISNDLPAPLTAKTLHAILRNL